MLIAVKVWNEKLGLARKHENC